MTPALVKAARALLEWDQRDLARTAKLSISAINSFERGLGVTRVRTIEAIKNALELHGIEFLSHGGLRRVDNATQILEFSGANFVAQANADIYNVVREQGTEISTCSIDEGLWFSEKHKVATDEFRIWCSALRIRERRVVPDNNNVFHAPRGVYRLLSQDLIGKITYSLYADRLSFIFWQKKQVVIMRNNLIADTFRRQFNHLWALGRKI